MSGSAGSQSPYKIRWMFHSTAMIADYDVAVDRLSLLCGLRVLEYSDNPQPEIGRRGGMTWIGDNSLELGQPTHPTGGAARFLERSGGGVHSIAVQVADIEETIAHVKALELPVAARPMEQIIFTDPRATHSVFVEWSSVEVHEDPRFGAAEPAFVVDPLLDVTHHAFIGAVVPDPVATADLMVEMFGTSVTFHEPDAIAGDPVIGVDLGDCSLLLFAMPPGGDTDLWGRDYERPRCHLIGLKVDDLDTAVAAMEPAGFTVVRRSESMVVIDPATTGGVQIALVDALPTGDPRL